MATFAVTNLNDSGAGSLRAAITAANADISGTPTVIGFAVSGTITLASALPSITQAVTIDGASAPGYAGGAPVVAVNFNGNTGLVFASGSAGSKLLSVAVDNASGNGVTLNDGSITLDKNYIGLNLTGQAAGNGGDGVYVAATSSNNQIGLNPTSSLGTAAAAGVVSNVISGNGGNGISFHGSSSNTVIANRIGTDPTGTTAIANAGNGIWITGGSTGNTIGGSAYVDSGSGTANNPTGTEGSGTPTFVTPPLGNLVSGNGQVGVLIDSNSQNNVLSGNFIGTTVSGNSALGNGGNGVWINGADNNSVIGTTLLNPPGSADPGSVNRTPFNFYNVVSGNAGNGLEVTNSNGVTVQANFFGARADNSGVVPNALSGILVDGSSQNTTVGGVIPLGNVTSGNGLDGIDVAGTVSGFVTFNTFGGGLAFGGAAPNGNDGLLITSDDSSGAGANVVQTNVFSGNTNNGIELAGNASGVDIEPNIVGLVTAGNAPLPNGGNGLLITGTAHDNTIGGPVPLSPGDSIIPNQAFSSNKGFGIVITGKAHDNVVTPFNFVGAAVSGIGPPVDPILGNGLGGVLIAGAASDNIVGGSAPSPNNTGNSSNVIAGNTGNGITLITNQTGNQTSGNKIGVDQLGVRMHNTGGQIVNEGQVASDFVGTGTSSLVTQTSSSGAVSIQTITGMSVASTAVTGTPGSSFSLVGIGDVNGDGTADLVYRQGATGLIEIQLIGQPTDALGNPTGPAMSPIGSGPLSYNPFNQTWNLATTGDFNGDGNADLVWRQAGSGLTEIQFLSGTQSVGGGLIGNNSFDTTWNIIGSGDFQGNGTTDLVWEQPSSGLVELQFLQGTNVVGGGVITNSPFGVGWSVVGIGDFNGDGTSDLVWQRQSDSLVEIQYLNGVTPVGGGVITGSPFDVGWNVVGVGDYNHDGTADLVYHRADGLTEVQYLNGTTPEGGGLLTSGAGNFNPGTPAGTTVDNLFTQS